MLSTCVWKSLSEERQEMGITLIVKCLNCAGLMLTTERQRTKICPYCGAHVNVEKALKIASAENVFEASRMLRKLKSEQGLKNDQS
jgi:acetyl-CoA carboxylase beta subunit